MLPRFPLLSATLCHTAPRTRERHEVDKALAALRDALHALLWRRRRRQQHQLKAVGRGRHADLIRLLQGDVGHEQACR